MRFQVPQFIETEVKIVGPFTLKQFFFIASGGIAIFILNFLLPLTYVIVFGIPIALLSLALAYYKVDGTPLFTYILHAISYVSEGKKYIFTEQTSVSEDIQQYLKQ